MTYRLPAAFAAWLHESGFGDEQTPVQVGQSDVYSLRWALPMDPGKDELVMNVQPVLSPDAQFIFRAYSNGRVEKRTVSNGEVQWVGLGVEVRGALAISLHSKVRIASQLATLWEPFMFFQSVTAPPSRVQSSAALPIVCRRQHLRTLQDWR